jgi:PncC family amidohydrolase
MQEMLCLAAAVAERLVAQKATLAVVESSAGGLISAALLSVPGASAYFIGGDIVYTRQSRTAFGITDADMAGLRSASPPYARLLAATARARLGTVWALAETGATGPSGNRYGDPAGHACLAVAGPHDMSRVLATGSTDRVANMRAFAAAALSLLLESLEG